MKDNGRRSGLAATNTLPTSLLTETALGNAVGPSGIPGADFSEYATQLGAAGNHLRHDSGRATPVAFPGNVIPRATCRSAARSRRSTPAELLEPYTKGIGLGSTGNLNGLDSNFHGSGTGSLNSDQWTVRGDLQHQPKDACVRAVLPLHRHAYRQDGVRRCRRSGLWPWQLLRGLPRAPTTAWLRAWTSP